MRNQWNGYTGNYLELEWVWWGVQHCSVRLSLGFGSIPFDLVADVATLANIDVNGLLAEYRIRGSEDTTSRIVYLLLDRFSADNWVLRAYNRHGTPDESSNLWILQRHPSTS